MVRRDAHVPVALQVARAQLAHDQKLQLLQKLQCVLGPHLTPSNVRPGTSWETFVPAPSSHPQQRSVGGGMGIFGRKKAAAAAPAAADPLAELSMTLSRLAQAVDA